MVVFTQIVRPSDVGVTNIKDTLDQPLGWVPGTGQTQGTRGVPDLDANSNQNANTDQNANSGLNAIIKELDLRNIDYDKLNEDQQKVLTNAGNAIDAIRESKTARISDIASIVKSSTGVKLTGIPNLVTKDGDKLDGFATAKEIFLSSSLDGKRAVLIPKSIEELADMAYQAVKDKPSKGDFGAGVAARVLGDPDDLTGEKIKERLKEDDSKKVIINGKELKGEASGPEDEEAYGIESGLADDAADAVQGTDLPIGIIQGYVEDAKTAELEAEEAAASTVASAAAAHASANPFAVEIADKAVTTAAGSVLLAKGAKEAIKGAAEEAADAQERAYQCLAQGDWNGALTESQQVTYQLGIALGERNIANYAAREAEAAADTARDAVASGASFDAAAAGLAIADLMDIQERQEKEKERQEKHSKSGSDASGSDGDKDGSSKTKSPDKHKEDNSSDGTTEESVNIAETTVESVDSQSEGTGKIDDAQARENRLLLERRVERQANGGKSDLEWLGPARSAPPAVDSATEANDKATPVHPAVIPENEIELYVEAKARGSALESDPAWIAAALAREQDRSS